MEVVVNDSNHRQMNSQMVTFLKQRWHQYVYIDIHRCLRGVLINGVLIKQVLFEWHQ